MIINNCYDSHLHWQGIGSFKSRLDLSLLNNIDELTLLKPKKSNFRSNWLLGHGWSKSLLDNIGDLEKNILDKIFPETPVYFTSPDIHSVWLNSKAIELLGVNNSQWISKFKDYFSTHDGHLSGLFYDLAKDDIDQRLPGYSNEQVTEHLLLAQNIIIEAGVTHIRDLTCSQIQLKQALELERNGLLKIVADLFFKLNTFSNLDQHIQNILDYKKIKTEKLKVKGVKVFLDGALGSGGALLTQNYLNGTNGFKLFTDQQIKEILIKCFNNRLEVAFHVIGDQSSLDVCRVLNELALQGKTGVVHLEHVQILTDECIELIKKLNIICHMQPQHWCSDQRWLNKTINESLIKKSFRWSALEDKAIKLYFGSDAPVEDMSVGHLIKCLEKSSQFGVKKLSKSVNNYLEYPEESPIRAQTFLNKNLEVEKVKINNETVYQKKHNPSFT